MDWIRCTVSGEHPDWVGLGWIHTLLDWTGFGLEKWTSVQTWKSEIWRNKAL